MITVERIHLSTFVARYRCIWSAQLYVVLLAQKISAIVPDPVARGADGSLQVNYLRLGSQFPTWEEWATKYTEKQPRRRRLEITAKSSPLPRRRSV
jgi:hypothetical protein